jgi:hypothetical protein
MATKDIDPGEAIVSIPRGLLITRNTVNEFLNGSLENDGWPLNEHASLSLYLVLNHYAPHPVKGNDRDHFWEPYFSILPSSFDSVASQFNSKLFDLLPCNLKEIASNQIRNCNSDYKAACSFVKTHFPAISISNHDWNRAWLCVNTRCITLPHRKSATASKGLTTMALAPFLDMLNHSHDVEVSTSWNETESHFEIRSFNSTKRYTFSVLEIHLI